MELQIWNTLIGRSEDKFIEVFLPTTIIACLLSVKHTMSTSTHNPRESVLKVLVKCT